MNHFHQFRDSLKDIIITKHFHRDAPGFDISIITDSKHDQCTHIHKYEENIDGIHIFRALIEHVHIVYAITKEHNLVFLRAFHNFKEYMKFLENRKEIIRLTA